MVYFDMDFIFLIRSMYKRKAILFFFWMGIGHQFYTILRVLHSDKVLREKLWKVQNKNVAIGSVGSTIVALIAITSLLFPVATKVSWLTRILWYSSTLSAFLAVMFSCKHQRFIDNLLFAEEEDGWAWKKLLHDGSEENPAKPRLAVVLLLSGTTMFFDLSLFLYVIGLAVYLGCIMTGNIDADTGEPDSRTVLIIFVVFAILCPFVYLLLDNLTCPGWEQGWECFRVWYEELELPVCTSYCGRRVCNPKASPPKPDEKALYHESRKLLFFLASSALQA
ncbi:hypothetical protein BDZ45DRAFT_399002 [Acephala macrosclerotiorum]|nr:hypothetical protein BDZ45DRAFT_399002 [Acephala macrosclerotiorum]